MDIELRRLIREHYPFPIAHAHKKTLAFLDDDAQKLKCLIQAAEATVQFLALVMLAQLHHDLTHQQAPALGQRGLQLWDDLRNPSFGKWHGLLRDLLKQYHAQYHLLVMPELFEVYFQPGRGSRLAQQPVVQQAIEPLITLRNQFHHPGIPDALIPEKVATATRCLEQLLERLQFLHAYPLNFVQRIEVRHDGAAVPHFRHDLVQMQGCFSIFERQRWESDVHLREGHLVLLTSAATGRSLFLDPFFACAEELPVPGVFDIFLLNGTEQRWARFLSAQCGQELSTDHLPWAQGAEYIEALGQFFDLLRRVPTTDTEVELEAAGQALPAAEAERAGASTEEVFRARYQCAAEARGPVSPYKFLDYFEPEDADLFFGRDQEIRQLQRKFHTARLLILHGESGTGKTSLIRAGLLPRLSPESYVPVYVRALQEPARAIKEAMVRQLGVDQRHLDLPLAQFLDAETAHLSKTVVVILDQFEEFFLRLPLEVRRLFHQELGACVAAAHLDVHFIIALRDDYFSSLAEFQEAIPDLFTHEMRLARFTHAQALAAAVEPVKRVGWSIDEALVAEVILPQLDELEKGIEPPLLQIVCDALYQQAQDASRTRIGAEEYASLGDVRQVLGRYLDATLRQFGPQQPQARAVLKALVTTEGTKRASFVVEIVARLHSTGLAMTEEAVERDFLRKLVQARLVRVLVGVEDIKDRPLYELSHEFLVQQIGTWIAESERELTKVLELIDRAYEAYRATRLLLEPEALALIAPFQAELILPAEQQRFLDLSRKTAWRRRRGRWLKVGASLLLVGLVIGGFLGVRLYRSNQQLLEEAHKAKEETRKANKNLAEALVEKGLTLLRKREFLSTYILGAQAVMLDPNSARAKSLAYLSAVSVPYVFNGTLSGHEKMVRSVVFSPDGRTLASASEDHTIRLWALPTGAPLATLTGHEDMVNSVAFSPDGRTLASASGDHTIRLWALPTGALLTTLTGHAGTVFSVAFSPDGHTLASGARDGTIRLWALPNGELLTTLTGHKNMIFSIAFNPDGHILASASYDQTIRLWTLPSGAPLATLSGHEVPVYSVAFSPDGRTLASGDREKTIRLWALPREEHLATLTGHEGWVLGMAFSPDGRTLASASSDQTIRLWPRIDYFFYLNSEALYPQAQHETGLRVDRKIE